MRLRHGARRASARQAHDGPSKPKDREGDPLRREKRPTHANRVPEEDRMREKFLEGLGHAPVNNSTVHAALMTQARCTVRLYLPKNLASSGW
jgi:hypothetical protein